MNEKLFTGYFPGFIRGDFFLKTYACPARSVFIWSRLCDFLENAYSSSLPSHGSLKRLVSRYYGTRKEHKGNQVWNAMRPFTISASVQISSSFKNAAVAMMRMYTTRYGKNSLSTCQVGHAKVHCNSSIQG